MNKLLRLFNIPTPYIISISISIVLLVSLSLQGTISAADAIGIVFSGLIIASSIYYGKSFVVNLVTIFISLYLASIYTTIVSDTYGLVSQPFFLTLAVLALFVAQSYGSTNNFNIRNRFVWTFILAFLMNTVKIALIISGFGFWITEVIGFNIFVIYAVTWRLWINNSKKTKINSPNVLERVDEGKFRYVYTDDKLDEMKNEWVSMKRLNSYPWIYNEVINAYEDGLILVVQSNCNNSKLYDLGEVTVNKSKVIPYLYMESTDERNTSEIIEEFTDDITKAEYYTKEGNTIV